MLVGEEPALAQASTNMGLNKDQCPLRETLIEPYGSKKDTHYYQISIQSFNLALPRLITKTLLSMMRTLIGLFLLCFTLSLSAQIVATTENGRKVVLNADGTWKYVDDQPKKEAKKKKGKKKDSKVPPTPTAVPEVKTVSMDNYKCGEIIGSRMNPQTQQQNQVLAEDMLISEPGDKHSFSMLLGVNSSKTYTWDLTLGQIKGCATQTPMVVLILKDGSEIKLPVKNDYVCDKQLSLFLSKGLGHKNELKALRAKPIQSIKVETRNSFVEEDLTAEQAAILQKAFNCLEGK